MRGRPRGSILTLAAVLAMLAWPMATEASDLLEAKAGEEVLGAAVEDFLRLGVHPVASTSSESPAWDLSAIRLDGPAGERLDGEPLATERSDEAPLALSLPVLDSLSAIGDGGAATSQAPHWSSLPFLGELAREKGYELPLPFGVTGAYNYIARDIKVTDVRVGVNGAPLSSVSGVASLKASSVVDAAVTKIDAWLLPFLNVYALLGYIKNVSDVHVQVTLPRPGPLPGTRQFTIKSKAELEGFVGGGGLTLAAGYRQFFAMADVNYTQTELGFDDRFRAIVASGRVGWNGKVGPVPFRLWGGAAYWDTKNTAKSTVDIPDVGSVRFEADQGPKHPWNAVVGVSATVHRHIDLFAEYGFNFNDVTFFAAGLTFRF